MTRPQAFENLPKTTVLEQIEQFTARFDVADDIPVVTGKLLDLLANYPLGGKQVHDANIVATMQAYGIPTLLTHNIRETSHLMWVTVSSESLAMGKFLKKFIGYNV